MKRLIVAQLIGVGLLVVVAGPPAFSQTTLTAQLEGLQEVPAIFSKATGRFQGRIESGRITYKLTYKNLEGTITQAHIHFGQAGVNGGISVFLCDTGGSPDPTGLAPACDQEGTVTGTITRDNTIGPAGQGIEAEGFAALAKAIRNNAAYVNVHSSKFPNSEIRGQIKAKGPKDESDFVGGP